MACFTSSYQTILNKLNGVRLFHLFQSTPCTALDSFEVSLTKKGLKRVLGLATHQKSPITPALLLQFKSHLDITTPADAALWCLFTVAFFSAILQYFTLVPAPDCAPFFCLPSHGSLRLLTHDVFSKAVKSRISLIGLSPSDFLPHSFRRGGATFAFQAGVPECLIQRHGNWHSDRKSVV